MTLILSAFSWTDNACLIRDVATLGYIKPTDLVLDPTYGQGSWWRLYKPHYMVTNCNDWDFRKAPYPDDHFDVVAYDPPYVAQGGRDTAGIDLIRYGQYDCPATPELLQELINDGLTEMARVTKPKGYILCKVKNYISSGKLWEGAYLTIKHAHEKLNLETCETFCHVGAPGPQSQTSQKHARNNYSLLFIFRKPRR